MTADTVPGMLRAIPLEWHDPAHTVPSGHRSTGERSRWLNQGGKSPEPPASSLKPRTLVRTID